MFNIIAIAFYARVHVRYEGEAQVPYILLEYVRVLASLPFIKALLRVPWIELLDDKRSG